MSKTRGFLAVAIVLSAVVVQAAAAEATPTAEVPRGVLLPYRYLAGANEFSKPPEDAGTISPHAVVIGLSGPIRFQVAIDATSPVADQPELVRFDFTGLGRFADAPIARLEITQRNPSAMKAKIGPVVIRVPVDGQLVAATVWGQYEKSGPSYRELKIGFDVGLKAECDFGGKRYPVCIVDGTGNLRLGDACKPVVADGRVTGRSDGDTVMIDTGEGTFKDAASVLRYLYGQPIWIDGAWYDVKVGDDGKSISVQPVGLPTGRIKVAAANWEMLLVGPERVVWVWSTEPGQELPVPAGNYVVMRYKQYAQFGESDSGAILMEEPTGYQGGQMDRTPRDPVVDVAADATVDVPIGTPLKAAVEVSLAGRDARFSLKVTDASGRRPQYVRLKGNRQVEPKLRVLDAAGNKVHAATMEYG
ncbi:MAG: hypothetical protein MUP47_01560 [Phycisphaerae bacterium]|nr:hypothetical protein [Phycisphaerae bacterium]